MAEETTTIPAPATTSNSAFKPMPSIETLFPEAWKALKGGLVQLIIFNLLMIGLGLILGVIGIIVISLTIGGSALALAQGHVSGAVFGVPLVIELIVFLLLYLAFSGAVQAGTIIILDSPKTHSIEEILKKSFKFGLPMVALGLITALLAIPAFFLFWIPGVFVIFFLFLSSYALVLGNRGVLGSLRRSAYLVKTYFWGMLLRAILWVGVTLLVGFALDLITLPLVASKSALLIGIIYIVAIIGGVLLNWFGASYLVTIYKQADSASEKGKETKLLWFVIVALLGLVFAALVIYGVAKSINSNPQVKDALNYTLNQSSKSGSTNSDNSSLENAFNGAYKSEFIKSCAQGGASSTTCSCMADYLVKNYTQSELIQISQNYAKTQQIPQELTNAASACVSK